MQFLELRSRPQLAKLLGKTRAVRKFVARHEVEQRVQLVDVVLQRGTRQQETVLVHVLVTQTCRDLGIVVLELKGLRAKWLQT